MKLLRLGSVLLVTGATLLAKALDSSYTLPKALADWVSESKSVEKQGQRVTSHLIHSPERSHIVVIAFVTGYTDRAITNDHFDTLVSSFAKEGLNEVTEKKRVTRYGMEGAQVTAQGVVQQKEFKGRGVILKSGESELTIMLFAVGVALDDPAFAVALSGLRIASR